MKNKWTKTVVEVGNKDDTSSLWLKSNFYWLVRPMVSISEKLERGWGNGYVAMPPDHPYADKEQFGDYIYGNDIVDENNKMQYYRTGDCYQEITASGFFSRNYGWAKTKKAGFTKEMEGYFMLGFDTAHGYHNSSHDYTFVLEQTLALATHLKNIYVDSKQIAYFRDDIRLFDESLCKDLNKVVKEHLGNKSYLSK
jgi:hypothetical protein